MGIIAKLKDVLGIAERGGRRRRADTADVTVEPEADATSERAVKGVEEPSAEPVDAGTVAETTGAADATADDEPVDAIKGIGSSYAERLGEAGIHTVEDLAAADADDLAEETGLGAGRIGNWIERAQVRIR